MLITIPDVLSPDQVASARQQLAAAEWVDGRVTAGYQAQEVKRNSDSRGQPHLYQARRASPDRPHPLTALHVRSPAAPRLPAHV